MFRVLNYVAVIRVNSHKHIIELRKQPNWALHILYCGTYTVEGKKR
jgi:hypothetical protein